MALVGGSFDVIATGRGTSTTSHALAGRPPNVFHTLMAGRLATAVTRRKRIAKDPFD